MRRTVFLIGLALLVAAAGAGALLYLGDPGRTYTVGGRIAGFGGGPATVYIEHDSISGYMPAMTMPFTAKDTSALKQFDVGDPVAFTLYVQGQETWIEDLHAVAESAVPRHPAGTPTSRRTSAASRSALTVGDQVPNLTFIDQDSSRFMLQSFRGKAVVVTFIYTRCPLPDQCPLMSRRFADLQPRLREAFGTKTRLLSISFDPEYDRPCILREYAARYTDRTDTWTFATGTSEQIGRATSLFQVFTKRGEGQIVHNLTTALIGPKGRLRARWRGNDWTTGEVFGAVRRVLTNGSPQPSG